MPLADIRGVQTTRLGNRHKSEPAVEAKDPRGKTIYWVGAAGPEQDAGPGTDFHAVSENYVSVSPIHVDLTKYNSIDVISRWLSDCEIGHE